MAYDPNDKRSTLERVSVGLAIFTRNGGRDVCAEHDEVYSGQGVGVALSDDDRATLKAAGWRIDSSLCGGCGPDGDDGQTDADGDRIHLPTCNQWSRFV